MSLKSDQLELGFSILSTNVVKKSLETEFSIAFCGPTGDNWQSKTLFIKIFEPRSSIIKSVFDCCLSGVDTDPLSPL